MDINWEYASEASVKAFHLTIVYPDGVKSTEELLADERSYTPMAIPEGTYTVSIQVEGENGLFSPATSPQTVEVELNEQEKAAAAIKENVAAVNILFQEVNFGITAAETAKANYASEYLAVVDNLNLLEAAL